ncbi:ISL3 family transposase [Clostridium thailandense]|uniref:ISL3 family transposase n=1 Tax=Clostridium thailandense TaxID=2794346 RepID=UPI003989901D
MPSIMDKSKIEKICVDDFAIRKRFSYGTIMVDLETHRIIDIIPSRETSDVKKWLETYPNLKIVSRDGSVSYASAITSSHPNALQISDRFHLIKGLSEAVTRFIIRKFPSRVEIPVVTVLTPEMQALYDTSNRAQRIRYAHQKRKDGFTISEIALLIHSSTTTINRYLSISENEIPEDKKISRERQHQFAVEQKQKEVDEARTLYNQGYSISAIGIMMHHNPQTIKKYLDPSYSAINVGYDVRIPGKLRPYENQVLELRSQGYTYQKIHDIISEAGYNGSVASLRMFMQKERAHAKSRSENVQNQKEYVQRKSLCQLVYKKLENIKNLSNVQYETIIKEYPIVGKIYTLIKEFNRIIFSKKVDELEIWISESRKHDIPELQSFLEGISKDIAAVKNSIIYKYNNGLAEGSVNKLKVIKRIMYGRNSFELLKAKLLLYEMMRF